VGLAPGPFDRAFAAIAATAASAASAAPAFAVLLRAAGRPRRRFRQHARGLGNRLTFAALARGAWLPGALAVRSAFACDARGARHDVARAIVATWLTHFILARGSRATSPAASASQRSPSRRGSRRASS
jgi:hypothetical protein